MIEKGITSKAQKKGTSNVQNSTSIDITQVTSSEVNCWWKITKHLQENVEKQRKQPTIMVCFLKKHKDLF